MAADSTPTQAAYRATESVACRTRRSAATYTHATAAWSMHHVTAGPTAGRAAIVMNAAMVGMMVVAPSDADRDTWPVAIVVVVLIGVAAIATAVVPIAVIINVVNLRSCGADALVRDKWRCTGRAYSEAGRDSECRATDCCFDWHVEYSSERSVEGNSTCQVQFLTLPTCKD